MSLEDGWEGGDVRRGGGWVRGMLKGWRGNIERLMRIARWGFVKVSISRMNVVHIVSHV